MMEVVNFETAIKHRQQKLQQLADAGHTLVGYIYPHLPLELFLAHQLIPTLLWADPFVPSAYEASLQTFCCAYARNFFSQRSSNRLPPIKGLVFPGGTCDSLQNLGDVWHYRFTEDTILRLTYPVATQTKASLQFLAEELRRFSKALEVTFGNSFSTERYEQAIALTSQFRSAAQTIAAARLLQPTLISYIEFSTLVRQFLTAPTEESLARITHAATTINKDHSNAKLRTTVATLKEGLQTQQLSEMQLDNDRSYPRIAIVGGMVDPLGIAFLFNSAAANTDHPNTDILFDLLSFGYRTIFTSTPSPTEDPFEELARMLVKAPTEPTQEGLSKRLRFLEEVLTHLAIDGLIICEQSFCDPDEFEAPAISAIAKKVDMANIRLHLDPEFSDRSRLENQIQSFLETLFAYKR